MSRKYLFILMMLSFILIFTACSNKEKKITLESRLDTYMNLWQEQSFDKMYDMVTEETKDTYGKEQFVDRYQKIYEDIGIENIEIDYAALTDEEIKTALENKEIQLPFSVSMDSIAGKIEFDYTVSLLLLGEGKEKDKEDEAEEWYIQWDPGYIFPALSEGGEVKIQRQRPQRGEIIDRNKMPLAMNDLIYEVGIVPEDLEQAGEHEKSEIARLLRTTVNAIDAALGESWVEPHLYVPIGKVPQTKTDVIHELRNLQSVQLRETTGRIYPGEEASAHIIGYVGQITAEELENFKDKNYSPNDYIGKTGLERLFEDRLRGEGGLSIYVETDDGEVVTLAEKEAKNGETIQLTMDINVQNELYKAYGKKTGTAAAINPKTGETLALVNSPSFDPNDFLYSNIQLITAKLEENKDLPLINRFTATYAPGSVLKPITAAIGLNNGSIDKNQALDIKGLSWRKNDSWGDFSVQRVSGTDQPVDLADALIRSDNIYFAMQAINMGAKKFVDGLKLFGFEDALPFDYPFTNSTVSSSGDIDHEFLLANSSYGQGELEMSALHLALAYSTFINDGNMIKPTLLLDDETGKFWVENILKPEDAKFIRDSLSDIVTKGTGKSAQRDKLAISGKTGTAELKRSMEDKNQKENGWFVGYPTKDQDILIAMLIESVENEGGSSYVADKVADVLVKLKK